MKLSEYHDIFFSDFPKDPVGNPVVTDWCPGEKCPFLPGPTHRHSLILQEDRHAYIRARARGTLR